MPTIAIVGAGKGLGLAIARTFASHDYDIALIARSAINLEALATQLQAEGARAAAFPADVRDRPALTSALGQAAELFSGIDVLEFSPVGTAATTTLTQPSQTTPQDLQAELEVQLFGAVTATAAVLPAMRAAGAGTLLFTTGAGSIDPVPMVANVNAAAAALRNWAVNLNKELTGSGVYAAHVGIDVSIDVPAIPGFPTAPASQIAESYWQLHQLRRDSEFVVTA